MLTFTKEDCCRNLKSREPWLILRPSTSQTHLFLVFCKIDEVQSVPGMKSIDSVIPVIHCSWRQKVIFYDFNLTKSEFHSSKSELRNLSQRLGFHYSFIKNIVTREILQISELLKENILDWECQNVIYWKKFSYKIFSSLNESLMIY